MRSLSLSYFCRLITSHTAATPNICLRALSSSATLNKNDKVVLVTGSTSGIGLNVARRLAKSGCDTIITGIAEKKVIDGILEEFKGSFQGKCTYVGADFTRENEIFKMCEEITSMYPRGIDILVNNAGIQHVASVDEFPVAKWHMMVAIHLTSSFLLTRHFLPFMKQKGWGRIVNIASMMGYISMPGKAVYSAMKSGLIGFTRGVSLDCAEYGVTCNAVCPGYASTELVLNQVADMAKRESKTFEQKRKEFFSSIHPTKKEVKVEEVASLVEYLCSDDAASITGTAILMDGGYTAR